MLYDPLNFLHSMAVYAANRSGTSLSPAVLIGYQVGPTPNVIPTAIVQPPFNLWLNEANEVDQNIAEPFAVLRIYGGTHERNSPKPTISVQLMALGKSNVPAIVLANALYRCLCLSNQERELRMIPIPGFKIADNSADGTWMLVNAVTVSMPGQAGRDDRGRVKVSSNFDLGFYKSS